MTCFTYDNDDELSIIIIIIIINDHLHIKIIRMPILIKFKPSG